MEMTRKRAGIIVPLFFVVCFMIFIFNESLWESIARVIFPTERELVYPRASLPELVREHLILVFVSSSLAVSIGFALGLFVTRRIGREFLSVVNNLTTLGQTFPPVAVLALAVPVLGFGFKPSIVALFLYSLLPVARNTIAGLEAVSQELTAVARGMGMNSMQVLFKVELPLAMKVIMAGVRISVVINIGTATVAAVVGAGGLGSAIIAGLVRDNPAFVLQGALTVALLAIIADMFLASLEEQFAKTNYLYKQMTND